MTFIDTLNAIHLETWIGLFGFLILVAGSIYSIIVGLRMKQPIADKTNVETINMLSRQVNELLEWKAKVEAAPNQNYVLKSEAVFKIIPEPTILRQSQTVEIFKGGELKEGV